MSWPITAGKGKQRRYDESYEHPIYQSESRMTWDDFEVHCRTLQMSRDRSWRDTCVSTGRDSCGRWLWRLVRLSFHSLGEDASFSIYTGVSIFFSFLRTPPKRRKPSGPTIGATMINVIQLILLISLLLEKEQSMIAATRNQTYAMLRTPPMMPMNEFMVLLPNDIDEPRLRLARLLPRRRRDSRGRWLWRLVRLLSLFD